MRKIRFLILTVIFLNTGTEGILVPYPLINGSNRLTGEYTKENWGTWIFTRCEDLDMSLIRKTPKEYLSVHADMNRIFYLLWEENSGMRKFKWRKIFGKKGRKDGEFRGCKGVCIDTTPRQNNPGDYFIYVADSRNDRIVCLRYHKKDEKMHFVCNINQTPRGKFKNPVDVSTLTLGEDNFFLLITDKGNHRIVLCHYVPGSGNTYISYGSEGEEEGKFYYPTSAVIVPADEGYRIYVADAGNSRVVLLNMDENYQISWVRTVKIGNVYLGDCSVEVSVYDKAVYLISEKKCRIYVYDWDLKHMIYWYGSFGVKEGQFNRPRYLTIYEGEAGITEEWCNTSGIQYFWLDCEVRNASCNPNVFNPAGICGIIISYTLTGGAFRGYYNK